MKPIVFIDVDGTLNCFPSPSFSQLMASQDWRDAEVNGYKIWWRKTVIDFFNELIRNNRIEAYWLTTWINDAPEILGPVLGLEHFSAIDVIEGSLAPVSNWWKWLRVKECLAVNSGPAIWLDDDLNESIQEEARAIYGDRLLMIRPQGNPGLSDEDLKRITKFIEANEKQNV